MLWRSSQSWRAALFVARDNGASSNQTVTSAGELASIQQACGQWRSAYTGSQAPPAAWCNATVGWMTTQTDGGYMMGSMMWGDAGRMRDTCLRWMATAPAVSGATSNASAWCDAMAGWMTQNGGPWTHMMGR